MAITHKQDLGVSANTGGASLLQSGPFGSTPTAGDSILVFLWTENATTVSSVFDSTGSNTYSLAGSIANSNDKCFVYHAPNIVSGASFKVSVQMSGNTFITFCASEFSLLLSSLDGAGSTNTGVGGGPGTSITTGLFSTTNTGSDLLIATFCSAGMASLTTSPSGFNSIGTQASGGTNEDGSAAYQIVTSTQTNINPTFTANTANPNKWACLGLAFKDGSSTGNLFRPSDLSGIGCGGPFFGNPLNLWQPPEPGILLPDGNYHERRNRKTEIRAGRMEEALFRSDWRREQLSQAAS